MCHTEIYANGDPVCQKHLEVDGQVCHTHWVQPVRPHFKCDSVVYSFADVILFALVSPFTQRSQTSLAEPVSPSLEPKHLDEK